MSDLTYLKVELLSGILLTGACPLKLEKSLRVYLRVFPLFESITFFEFDRIALRGMSLLVPGNGYIARVVGRTRARNLRCSGSF